MSINYKVFISHAGTDTWVARQLQRHIGASGADTFLDEGDIYVGDDFENVLLANLRSSNEVLVLLTPWALQRKYVWLEVGAAWVLGLRMAFVLYGITEADLSAGAGNPALIKRTNVIEVNSLDKYLAQLTSRLKAGP
jgi:hypothetical protein